MYKQIHWIEVRCGNLPPTICRTLFKAYILFGLLQHFGFSLRRFALSSSPRVLAVNFTFIRIILNLLTLLALSLIRLQRCNSQWGISQNLRAVPHPTLVEQEPFWTNVVFVAALLALRLEELGQPRVWRYLYAQKNDSQESQRFNNQTFLLRSLSIVYTTIKCSVLGFFATSVAIQNIRIAGAWRGWACPNINRIKPLLSRLL